VANGLVEGSFALGGAATLGVVLGAPAIVDVVAGERFAGAADALRIQGAALGLTFLIAVLGFTLLSLHRHRALLACNVLAFAVTAVAVALLASAHGERGAALATVIGEATLCVAYALAVSRDVRLRPRRVPRALVALGLGLGAGALIGPAVLATAAGLAVYAIALVVLRAAPRELLRRQPSP
jgi:O-antigen/teichoic acid export membrane protein